VAALLQCPQHVSVNPTDIIGVKDRESRAVVIFDRFDRNVTRYSGAGIRSGRYARTETDN
jgi:hypothetical protein